MSVLSEQAGHGDAAGDLGHFLGVDVFNLLDGFVDACDENVGQGLDVIGIDDLGLDIEGENFLLAVDLDGDNAAACGDLVFLCIKLFLQVGQILLHLLCLTDHSVHVLGAAAHTLG